MGGPESRYIPGIYNYCDYWCERCAFTRRCRNFTMGRERERTREDVEEEARQIGELIEVVAWYHTFIPPKLSRAGLDAQPLASVRGRTMDLHPMLPWTVVRTPASKSAGRQP